MSPYTAVPSQLCAVSRTSLISLACCVQIVYELLKEFDRKSDSEEETPGDIPLSPVGQGTCIHCVAMWLLLRECRLSSVADYTTASVYGLLIK